MAHGDTEVVRRLYAGWEAGDFAVEMDSYDPDVELVIDYGPDQISARGIDEMRDVWREQLTLWDSWSTGPIQTLVEDGDRVVVGHSLRGRSKRGISVHMEEAGCAFILRDGRVTWIFATDRLSKALQAVGLLE